jgi:endo-1,4-beta-xylanase
MLVAAMLSMLIVIGGCSKKEQETPNDVTSNNSEEQVDDTSSEESNELEDENSTDVDEVDQVADEVEDVEEVEEVYEEYIVGELPLITGGIKGVYDSNGFKNTGTCINGFVTKTFADNIIENYNSVTMENDMKPEAILSQSKSIAAGDLVVDYPQRTIDLLEWSKANNMKVRGHVLVWHSQTPQWIFYEDFDTKKPLVDRDTMLARMDSYIKQNFALLESLGYLDIFYAYDIVNEAVEDNGTLRDSLWKRIIGDDYIWHAFYYADKYAPEHIKLYYNDYNEQFKTQALVDLAKSLVDESGRSLIDGIGCQAHLYTGDSIFKYMKTLEAFSATGLDVQITEIDVSLGTWQNILEPTDENLRVQGQYYYELVNSIIEGNKAGTTNISGITFWGVSDGASWRRDRNPLLFNLDFMPKYSYFGAVQDKAHAGY